METSEFHPPRSEKNRTGQTNHHIRINKKNPANSAESHGVYYYAKHII
jgi:hypothetical protein